MHSNERQEERKKRRHAHTHLTVRDQKVSGTTFVTVLSSLKRLSGTKFSCYITATKRKFFIDSIYICYNLCWNFIAEHNSITHFLKQHFWTLEKWKYAVSPPIRPHRPRDPPRLLVANSPIVSISLSGICQHMAYMGTFYMFDALQHMLKMIN